MAVNGPKTDGTDPVTLVRLTCSLFFLTLDRNTVPSSHTPQIKEKKVDGHSMAGATDIVVCFVPFSI